MPAVSSAISGPVSMGDRRIAARRAGGLVLAAWAAGIACASCGGSDSSSAATSSAASATAPGGGGAPAPGGAATSAAAATSGGGAASTGAGLPFHYESTGQGGSASFTIPSNGTYKVDWTASGVAGAPACTVSLGLSADTSSYSVVDGVQVGPADRKSGSISLTLAAGGYRAVEGGGCGWSITVHPL